MEIIQGDRELDIVFSSDVTVPTAILEGFHILEIEQGNGTWSIDFAGVSQLHPMEERVHMGLTLTGGVRAVNMFVPACRRITAKLDLLAEMLRGTTHPEHCKFVEAEHALYISREFWGDPLLNSIRRSVVSRVKSCAIATVVFDENRSVYPDEILANRIGLIPLVCGLQKAPTGSLKKRGPAIVKAGDIQFTVGARACDTEQPIAELFSGDVLDLSVVTDFGTQDRHARYASVLPPTQRPLAYYVHAADSQEEDRIRAALGGENGHFPLRMEGKRLEYLEELLGRGVRITQDDTIVYTFEPVGQWSSRAALMTGVATLQEEITAASRAFERCVPKDENPLSTET